MTIHNKELRRLRKRLDKAEALLIWVNEHGRDLGDVYYNTDDDDGTWGNLTFWKKLQAYLTNNETKGAKRKAQI